MKGVATTLLVAVALLLATPAAAADARDAEGVLPDGTAVDHEHRTVTYRHDDGSAETYVSVDYRDDFAQKTLTLRGERIESATFHVYGQSSHCGTSGASVAVLVNQVTIAHVDACATWPQGTFGWASFDVPPRYLVPGTANRFQVAKSGPDWTQRNVLVGVDSDTNDGRSGISQNGKDIPGELVVYLVAQSQSMTSTPRTPVGDVPSGAPAPGRDADGDGVPSTVTVPRCTLIAGGHDGATCEPTAPAAFGTIDPDDGDARNPAAVPTAAGVVRVGCETDAVCAEAFARGAVLGNEVDAGDRRVLSLAGALDAVESASGARPVRLAEDAVTVMRPSTVAAGTPGVDETLLLHRVTVDEGQVALTDANGLVLTLPGARVSGVANAGAEPVVVAMPRSVTERYALLMTYVPAAVVVDVPPVLASEEGWA